VFGESPILAPERNDGDVEVEARHSCEAIAREARAADEDARLDVPVRGRDRNARTAPCDCRYSRRRDDRRPAPRELAPVGPRDLHVIDDARIRHVERGDPGRVRFMLAELLRTDSANAIEPIGAAAPFELVESQDFARVDRHDDLAATLEGNAVLGAELLEETAPASAHHGLLRTGFVIEACVNDAAVVSGLVRCESRLLLEQREREVRARGGDGQGRREAHDSAAHDGDVDLCGGHAAREHSRCARHEETERESQKNPREGLTFEGVDLNGPFVEKVALGRCDGPLLLAFTSDGSDFVVRDDELARIRAELRGLGATLVVVSAESVWQFRPDDDVERFERRLDTAAEVERLCARCGLGSRAPASESVFLVDPHGGARLVSRTEAGAGPLARRLVTALSSAGRDVVAESRSPIRISRRECVTSALLAGFAFAAGNACAPVRTPSAVRDGGALGPPVAAPGEIDVVLTVNGERRPLRIEPRVSLLDALRERLDLPGSKKGCDHGQCGACTVLVDGRRVYSCLTLAVMAQNAKITTIEGLARGDTLHPMQAAFVAEDGLQCGYCTPGQILSAVGLVTEGRARTDDEVREQMSGNICRCGAYQNIVRAIQLGRKAI
jgi:xanthine dehydrogenase YagT iron-sulfur-binding subunit